MKHCPRCGIDKPLDAFNRNRAKRDGRQGHCRTCQLEDNREWAERRPWVRRATMRRQNAARMCQTSRHGTPHQRRAHRTVERAVAKGILTRPDRCPACGKDDSPIHAHHHDYDKPLDVQWLCSRCHQRLHAQERRREQVRPTHLRSSRTRRRPAA